MICIYIYRKEETNNDNFNKKKKYYVQSGFKGGREGKG